MELNIVGRNVEVTEALRKYVQKKIGKLDRYLPSITDGKVELSKQTAKSASDRHIVQVTLRSNGTILRAEERNADIFASIDAVVDKMQRQIDRFKGKRYRSRARPKGQAVAAPAPEEEEEPESPIARRKRFVVHPMSEDEAIEQMELLGHDFFVFYNSRTEELNVLYRRNEGNYGILEPELQ